MAYFARTLCGPQRNLSTALNKLRNSVSLFLVVPPQQLRMVVHLRSTLRPCIPSLHYDFWPLRGVAAVVGQQAFFLFVYKTTRVVDLNDCVLCTLLVIHTGTEIGFGLWKFGK